MTKNGMRPAQPGEVLREEYLAPMDMSVHALSLTFRVATRLRMIVKERRSVNQRPILSTRQRPIVSTFSAC